MVQKFNLIHEPWIPVKDFQNKKHLVSIRDLIDNAQDFREIFDTSPLVNGSMYRLLIALLHRALNGPKTKHEWLDLWQSGKFSNNAKTNIDQYLTKWEDRFFLIDDKYPFYQVADLNESDPKTIAVISPQLSSGNNATLFDHSVDNDPPAVSFAEAARWMLAHQNFVLGGLTSPYKSKRKTTVEKSAKGGPLASGCLIVITGNNLFQTLILNLHQYDPNKDIPFRFERDDKPVWERDTPTLPESRFPMGLTDWMTWQSRAVKLITDSETTVKYVLNMVGESLDSSGHRKNYETMAAFSVGKGKDPFPILGYFEGRSIWRDCNALYQSQEDKFCPKTMEWIENFKETLDIDQFPLELFGMANESGKVIYELWRHETLPFKLGVINNSQFRTSLNNLLAIMERCGTALWVAANSFFKDAVPDIAQKLKSSGKLEKNDNDRIRSMISSTNILNQYWSELELPFKKKLSNLISSPTEYSETEIDEWEKLVSRIGANALSQYFRSFQFNAISLHASTHAQATYYWRIKNV